MGPNGTTSLPNPADALTAVEVTVAAMMGNSAGTVTTTSDSGITGDNNG